MKKSTVIRSGRHCIFNLYVHLVFVAKYRRKVFNKTILNDLKKIFSDVCTDFESVLVEFDGEGDHVHLLINYPPKITISKIVNSLKGVSSRLIKKNSIVTILVNSYGKTLGHRVILREVVEELLSTLFAST